MVSPSLRARLAKAAQRGSMSQGEWVRRAIERALAERREAEDPLDTLASVGAPTADIDQMLAEIEAGRT